VKFIKCCSGQALTEAAAPDLLQQQLHRLAAIAATGWRMVVSAGQIVVASGVSSNPAMVRSFGTSGPHAVGCRDRCSRHVIVAGEYGSRFTRRAEHLLAATRPE